MVDKVTAERVAAQEKEAIEGYLEGIYGDEKGRRWRNDLGNWVDYLLIASRADESDPGEG
jgi:hypothetical protein